MPKLTATVVLHGEEGQVVTLLPGTEAPEWALPFLGAHVLDLTETDTQTSGPADGTPQEPAPATNDAPETPEVPEDADEVHTEPEAPEGADEVVTTEVPEGADEVVTTEVPEGAEVETVETVEGDDNTGDEPEGVGEVHTDDKAPDAPEDDEAAADDQNDASNDEPAPAGRPRRVRQRR